jgi:DNA-binding response OmpR family regulator
MKKMTKILIIEDDPTILSALANAFAFFDFTVMTAGSSEAGLERYSHENPDLIILDVMLPGIDGFELCRKIRQQDKRIPIVMLTAKNQESDKLLGFELGVDDYVTKPFSAKELIARVRAILKRSQNRQEGSLPILVGEVEILFEKFIVKREGKELALSPKELDILKLLIENPEKVISRDQIIDHVWGDEYFPSPKTIDNFIVKLRGKIENDPKNPCHIITVHGAGYKFKF